MFAAGMTRFFKALAAALTGLLIAAGSAAAHPHVWVTMKSELVYAADGSVTGVRHAWAFDEMFSTFATQGLETKQKGVFTREDLAPLAQVNIDSLKDFDYFTFAKANGKKAPFNGPADYWLDFADSVLTGSLRVPSGIAQVSLRLSGAAVSGAIVHGKTQWAITGRRTSGGETRAASGDAVK